MPLDLTHQTAIRWADPDPKFVPLLAEGGITLVLAPPQESFAKACLAAGIQVAAEQDLQFLSLSSPRNASAGLPVVIKDGSWPGVQMPDPDKAGATESVWLEQNCFLVRYLGVAYPHVPAVLGYLPDKDAGVSPNQFVRFEALELALVEAWASGGNYLMALHPRYRKALLDGKADALAAWRRLGRTARWLRANAPLFSQPMLPIITVLVGGDLSEEIAKLSFRHAVSPTVAMAATPPLPDPAHCWLLSAVGIDTPKTEAADRILAHAQAGTTVVVDGNGEKAWWRVAGLKLLRRDGERDFYSFGKGRVVVYRDTIDDPGMVALDLVDIVTQKRRPARIWNCGMGVVMATGAPRSGPVTGTALLHVINYGHPEEMPVLARIQGRFKRATLYRPEGNPQSLKVAPRGSSSEVTIPKLERIATVVFA